MARTPSTMLELGTAAPDFALQDPGGVTVRLPDFGVKPALLVAFICNHCPFVKHIQFEMAEFAAAYQPKGLGMVAINSNDPVSHPEDSPSRMAEEARRVGYAFPYLVDETQSVAKAFRAACTPDFFLFDRGRKLVYRGQFDSSRPGNGVPVTGADLRDAVEAVLDGRPVAVLQKPSVGCNIKWKPGNEPDYYQDR